MEPIRSTLCRSLRNDRSPTTTVSKTRWGHGQSAPSCRGRVGCGAAGAGAQRTEGRRHALGDAAGRRHPSRQHPDAQGLVCQVPAVLRRLREHLQRPGGLLEVLGDATGSSARPASLPGLVRCVVTGDGVAIQWARGARLSARRLAGRLSRLSGSALNPLCTVWRYALMYATWGSALGLPGRVFGSGRPRK